MFGNILTKSAGPDPDPKYRRLRLQNPKISAAIVDVDGGIEALQVICCAVLPQRRALAAST